MRSRGAKTKINPGPLAADSSRPRRKITPRSYSARILMELRRYRATMIIAIVPNEIGIASIASREALERILPQFASQKSAFGGTKRYLGRCPSGIRKPGRKPGRRRLRARDQLSAAGLLLFALLRTHRPKPALKQLRPKFRRAQRLCRSAIAQFAQRRFRLSCLVLQSRPCCGELLARCSSGKQ